MNLLKEYGTIESIRYRCYVSCFSLSLVSERGRLCESKERASLQCSVGVLGNVHMLGQNLATNGYGNDTLSTLTLESNPL